MMRVPSAAARVCAQKSSVRGVAVRAMSTSKFLREVSEVPTMYYQDSLPRLPIPKLEDTCAKYLRSASAIMSPEAMEVTTAKVKAFEAGPGKRLQMELVNHDDAHSDTSYISEPWFDMYLENRAAFPLNLSPQLTWKDDPDAAKMEQAARCANILGAAARFCNSLRANVLVPDVFHTKKEVFDNPLVKMGLHLLVPRRFAFYGAAAAGSYPLDMSQYGALFSSTRIPQKGKDRIVTQSVDQTFVIVQRGSAFYKVHIMDPKTGPLPEEKIEAQLRAVLADKPSNDYPVGVLSAIDRDWAAELRPELVAMNKEAMHDIDSALFCVTLDDEAPTDDAALSRLMLHGNGRNRWFEKSFHIVVAANGKAGVNWEHSWGDGVAMLRFFEEVYKEISAEPARPKVEAAEPATPYDFCLSPNLQANIVKAEKVTDEFFASAELEILQTDALAKGDLKKEKLSPDGTMQMVLQLAHNRMHGYTAATYESASTAAFKHGRTETIRSATIEANEFVAAFQNPDTSRADKVAALRKAVDQHSAITKDAVMGKGFDRHLFGLRYIAQKKGLPVPDIYSDETYQTMMDIRLSTSTLSSAALGGGGFGPISPTAYSCGYGIVDEGCRFHIMTNGLGTKEFTEHLASSAADIKAAITGSD